MGKRGRGEGSILQLVLIRLFMQFSEITSPTLLLDAAKAECSSFMEAAVRDMKLLEQTNLLEAPSPEPRVTIQIIETGHTQLVLRFPAPDRGRSRVEQAILRRYLTAASTATN